MTDEERKSDYVLVPSPEATKIMQDAMNPTYPSGAPMPLYGPSTPDELITDGLEWAFELLVRRDQMNAAVHCGPTRLSDVTVKVQTALGLWRERLAAARAGEQE